MALRLGGLLAAASAYHTRQDIENNAEIVIEEDSLKFEGDDNQSSAALKRSRWTIKGRKSTEVENLEDADSVGPTKVKTRWTPILSGIICPFAVLLEIPGLTSLWYIKTVGAEHHIIETQPNPIALDAALGLSMALGALASGALVLRFLERYVYASTLIAIACLTIHDIINVICVTVFGVVHRVNDGFTYSSAFWMTVASSAASSFCNLTLVYDFIRTKNFKEHGSGLTTRQRQLVISIMAMITYLALGALIYAEIMHLAFENALYFVIVSCTSVGFGDIVPTNTAAKILTFFYTACGIILVAIVIAQAREVLVESFAAAYRQRRSLLIAKAKERREKRKAAQEEIQRWQKESRERGHGHALLSQFHVSSTHAPTGGRGGLNTRHQALPPPSSSSGISGGKAAVTALLVKLGLRESEEERQKKEQGAALTRTLSTMSLDDDAYRSLRKRVEQEERNEYRIKLTIAILLFLTFWTCGAAVFCFAEKWSYFDSLYFCFVFFSTIGYGDFTPKTPAGRAFFIAWSLFGIACLTLLFSVLTENWSTKYKSSIQRSKVKQALRKIQSSRQVKGPKDIAFVIGVPNPQLSSGASVQELSHLDHLDKLISSIKAFDEHAKFLMNGRQGERPAELRVLMENAHDPDQLAKIRAEIGDTATTEAEESLLLFSYYSSFDSLIGSAERVKEAVTKKQTEIDELKMTVAQLQETMQRQTRLVSSLADNEDGVEDHDSDEEGEEKGRADSAGEVSETEIDSEAFVNGLTQRRRSDASDNSTPRLSRHGQRPTQGRRAVTFHDELAS